MHTGKAQLKGTSNNSILFPNLGFFQLLRYQNTHLTMLNSVFGVLYLKKIPAFVFQKELIEVP
jgi:hypothetical protein